LAIVSGGAEGLTVLDLAPWLSPIDGDNPSGESLRDDPKFHEIESLIRAGSEIVRDELNNPVNEKAVPVDWARVMECAEALRTQGRDLRLHVIVARALLNEQGPAGLAEGLTLIAKTIETHWETLHPELRPASNPRDAALRRLNALLQLQNDDAGVLGDLRRRTAFTVRGLGPVSGADLEQGSLDSRTAQNEAAPGMSEEERAAFIARHEQLVGRVHASCAALLDKTPQEHAELLGGMRAAAEALAAVEAALAAKMGDQNVLGGLKKALGRMLGPLERSATAAASSGEAAAGATVEAPGEQSLPAGAPAPATAGGSGVPDRLSNRAEVVACLDRIIEFYDRTEPASPVPYLARRMRRMVPMDFLELMEDLAPSGLREFRALAGLSEN
jgi:type VI secretion system protein ImpA